MGLMCIKRSKCFVVALSILLVASVQQIECVKGGGGSRSSGGGSRGSSSSHSTHTSHSSPSHSFGTSSHSTGSGSHSSFSPGGGFHSPSSGSGIHSSSGSSFHPSSSGGTHISPSGTSHNFGTSASGSHIPSGGTSHNFGPSAGGTHIPSSGTSHNFAPSAPSAPHLPGYTVTGGTGFIPHSSSGTKPIGFDNVNQQAHNSKPLNPPPATGGIGFEHHQQTHNTPLNSGNPPTFGNSPQTAIHNGPPGYTVTGGIPSAGKPGGIGFDNVNQQAHNTQLNNAKPFTPSAPSGGIGFDHVNQQAQNNLNPGRYVTPSSIGQHNNPIHSAPSAPNYQPNVPHPQQNYPLNAGTRPGIGFDHVNQQSSGVRYNTPAYHPYTPTTVVQPNGYVHYQPPVQLQYTPPVTVHHHTTHIVPVYQPSVIYSYGSSGIGGGSVLSHGGAFLGGYLIGRLSTPSYGYHSGYQHTHVTNNYYNNDPNYNTGVGNSNTGGSISNSYYTVHHHYQNRDQIPSQFVVPGENLKQCQENITEQLCVPNTNAFCLKNGTIMCTTPSILTMPCGGNSSDSCVYSRIDCNGNPACNLTANQTYIEFSLPCISNVTYSDNKVVDGTAYKKEGSYQLCVTAIAHPKKLESPVAAVANFFMELTKYGVQFATGGINNNSSSVFG